MTEQSLATVQEKSYFLAPAASLQQLGDRYNQFNKFITDMLVEGVDYLTIPGTGKPSLAKPGAEKLSTFFALSPKFIQTEQEKDWTGENHGGEPFFYFAYRCDLYRGDQHISSCEGSCNSWEVKYRYRQGERKCPKCGKSTIIKGKDEYGGGWLCFGKKGGCGAKFADGDQSIEGQQVGRVVNPDVADIVNTLQKMAQKRSYVGAVLLATNSSERFTQDVEDMAQFGQDVVDGEYKPIPPKQSTANNQQRQAPATNKVMIKVGTKPYVKSWLDTIKDKFGANVIEISKVIDSLDILPTWQDATAIGALEAYFSARKNVESPATQEEATEAANEYIQSCFEGKTEQG